MYWYEFSLYFVLCPPQPKKFLYPLLTARYCNTSMADSRQPEDPEWDPSMVQETTGTQGANGYSTSAYRTCQPSATHVAAGSYSARENGFNGELTGAHAATAGKVDKVFIIIQFYPFF